jgi:hypothetical protein
MNDSLLIVKPGMQQLPTSVTSYATRIKSTADEFRKRFGTADLQEAQVPGKTYCRVRLGRYSSLRAARTGQAQYEHSNFAGCLVFAVV